MMKLVVSMAVLLSLCSFQVWAKNDIEAGVLSHPVVWPAMA